MSYPSKVEMDGSEQAQRGIPESGGRSLSPSTASQFVRARFSASSHSWALKLWRVAVLLTVVFLFSSGCMLLIVVVSAPAAFSGEYRAPAAYVLAVANVLLSLKLWVRADPAYRNRTLNGYGDLFALDLVALVAGAIFYSLLSPRELPSAASSSESANLLVRLAIALLVAGFISLGGLGIVNAGSGVHMSEGSSGASVRRIRHVASRAAVRVLAGTTAIAVVCGGVAIGRMRLTSSSKLTWTTSHASTIGKKRVLDIVQAASTIVTVSSTSGRVVVEGLDSSKVGGKKAVWRWESKAQIYGQLPVGGAPPRGEPKELLAVSPDGRYVGFLIAPSVVDGKHSHQAKHYISANISAATGPSTVVVLDSRDGKVVRTFRSEERIARLAVNDQLVAVETFSPASLDKTAVIAYRLDNGRREWKQFRSDWLAGPISQGFVTVPRLAHCDARLYACGSTSLTLISNRNGSSTIKVMHAMPWIPMYTYSPNGNGGIEFMGKTTATDWVVRFIDEIPQKNIIEQMTLDEMRELKNKWSRLPRELYNMRTGQRVNANGKRIELIMLATGPAIGLRPFNLEKGLGKQQHDVAIERLIDVSTGQDISIENVRAIYAIAVHDEYISLTDVNLKKMDKE